MTPEKKIERLIKLLELTNEDYASKAEVREVIQSFVSFLKELKLQVDTSLNTTTGNVTSNMTKFEKQLLGRLDTITKSLKEELVQRSRDELYAETQRLSTQLRADLEVVRSLIPTVPDLSPLAARIEDVAKAIPTVPAMPIGEDYRNALEVLQGEDRLDISAIRGLDGLQEQIVKAILERVSRTTVITARYLDQIGDVDLDDVRENELLQYDSTTRTWQNGIAITVAGTAPSNPKVGDLWIDTTP